MDGKKKNRKYKIDCSEYSLINEPINSNFYFVNAHGDELEKLYEIPPGVRIVMFCYSKNLDVCQKFDKFNWENILLDPVASSNYCNFLSAISQYSSIKDHFCVYEPGDVIRNLLISTDKTFREGLYRLPVKGYAYDVENNTIVVSDGTLLSEVHKDEKLNKMMKKTERRRVAVDGKRVADLLRVQSDVGIVQSQVRKIHKNALLSNLINSLRMHMQEFTILLMVCRTRNEEEIERTKGVAENISSGKFVSKELDRMQRHLQLEKMMR